MAVDVEREEMAKRMAGEMEEVTGVGTEKQTAAGKASQKVEAMVTQTEAATGKPKAKEAEKVRVAKEMPMEAGMVKLAVARAE